MPVLGQVLDLAPPQADIVEQVIVERHQLPRVAAQLPRLSARKAASARVLSSKPAGS